VFGHRLSRDSEAAPTATAAHPLIIPAAKTSRMHAVEDIWPVVNKADRLLETIGDLPAVGEGRSQQQQKRGAVSHDMCGCVTLLALPRSVAVIGFAASSGVQSIRGFQRFKARTPTARAQLTTELVLVASYFLFPLVAGLAADSLYFRIFPRMLTTRSAPNPEIVRCTVSLPPSCRLISLLAFKSAITGSTAVPAHTVPRNC
jgi:hypothetical protein